MIADKKYILFDLDGTLTDPKVGICTSVQYALKEEFGIEEPDLDKLQPFIGPPLKDSFMEFYGLSEEQAETAIAKYRERFSAVGKFENEIYPGMSDLLVTLKNYGYRLAVASSKPEIFVKEIMEHFHIAQYFDVMAGSELDGARTDKAEVISETLNRVFHYGKIYKDQVIMIGDRKFDIMGAKEIGVTSVAVGYGYGSKEELEAAEPDYIAETVSELHSLLIDDEVMKERLEKQRQEVKAMEEARQAAKERRAKGGTMGLLWSFLFPFLLFQFAGEFIRQAYNIVLSMLADKIPPLFDFMFVEADSTEEMLAVSGNGMGLIQILTLITITIIIYKFGTGKQSLAILKAKKVAFKETAWAVWLLTAVLVAAGLNMAMAFSGALEVESYEEAATNLYSVGIPLGLILYGICSPIAEELVFRGIIFTQMRSFMKPTNAVMLSAAMFGLYHGNGVQMVYGLCLGMILALALEESNNILICVLMHSVLNIIVYLATSFGWLTGSMAQAIAGVVCLIAGLLLFLLRYNKYKAKAEKEIIITKGK